MKKYGKIGFHFIFNPVEVEHLLNKFSNCKIIEIRKNNWGKGISEEISKNDIRIYLSNLGSGDEIFIIYEDKLDSSTKYALTVDNSLIEVYIGFWPTEEKINIDVSIINFLFNKSSFGVFGFELEVFDKFIESTLKSLSSHRNNLPFYLIMTEKERIEMVTDTNIDQDKTDLLKYTFNNLTQEIEFSPNWAYEA